MPRREDRGRNKPRSQEDTDLLTSQMIVGGSLDLQNMTREQAKLIAVFTFARGNVLTSVLKDQEHGRDLLMALAETLVETVGMARVLDALTMVTFNECCNQERGEIEQNAWRRTADVLLQARASARANQL